MCINRPLYQCEGAGFFSSEMRKVRASVNSDFSEALHPDSRTLYPESGNRDWGIKEQDTGLRRGGSSSSPAEVLFLRVEGYNPKKRKIFYSKNYYYYRLPHTQSSSSGSLRRQCRSIFSQHPIIYRPTHQKNRTPTGGVSPLFKDPPKGRFTPPLS